MTGWLTGMLGTLGLILSGCAADVAGGEVAANQAPLFDELPIIGDLLPGGVTETVDSVEACTDALVTCTAASESPSELTACNETYAHCVAGTLDVTLPELPASHAVACAEKAAQCTLDARSVSDVTGCASGLTSCAADRVELVGVVDDVVGCTDTSVGCIEAAESPSELTACAEAEVDCVAGGLGVDLPDLPVSEATACAEDAAQCTLGADRLSHVFACSEDLLVCAESTISETPVVDCSVVFTRCLAQNPLRFFMCAQESQACYASK